MSSALGLTDDQWEVIGDAATTYGAESQVMMFIGELGEFLTHFGRMAQGRFDRAAFADELADVHVTLASIAYVYGVITPTDQRIDAKIDRLQQKLADRHARESELHDE